MRFNLATVISLCLLIGLGGAEAAPHCSHGAYKCSGSNFLQCDNGKWVTKACGAGTRCVQRDSTHVYCDYENKAAGIERRAPSECKPGAYKCSGKGFLQCDNGSWVHKSCGRGTKCVQNGPNAVYCDYSAKMERRAPKECKAGAYKCNGQGFLQCDNGKWVHKSCGSGTTCVQNGPNAVYCDYAKKGPHHGLGTKSLLSSSHGSDSGSNSGGECRPGTYQCAGQGFRQCDNGKWVHKDCGSGTACVQNGEYAVYCDYAKLV